MVRSSWLLDREGAVREGCEICRFKNSNFTLENTVSKSHHQTAVNPAHRMSNVTVIALMCGPRNSLALQSSEERLLESI